MNEPQNNQMPPQQQTGPQPGPAAPQQAGPQGYGPPPNGYQDHYQGGYGHPPAPGNGPPPWAHQGCQHGGGYQDQYQGGYGHPPVPGNHPPWAHQDRHQGGHPAYYGPPPAQQPHPGYGAYPAAHGSHAAAYGPPPGYYAQPAYASHHHDSGLGSFFNFRDERFIKGAITGAALTFLLTNDSVQKNGIKSLVKLWSLFQGGMEEIKERFKDAEAEIKTESQPSNSGNG
jgi:hypothetical protein